MKTTRIQPTTLTWCTEPLGDNRYFAVTDDGVVTRSGESGEPLDVTGMILGIGGVTPKWQNDNSDFQGRTSSLETYPLKWFTHPYSTWYLKETPLLSDQTLGSPNTIIGPLVKSGLTIAPSCS